MLTQATSLCSFAWHIVFLTDLRDDKQFFLDHPGTVPITTAQGEELKKLIGAAAYIECSSKTQQNVKFVFDAAIKVVLQPPKQKRRKKRKAQKACSILWAWKGEQEERNSLWYGEVVNYRKTRSKRVMLRVLTDNLGRLRQSIAVLLAAPRLWSTIIMKGLL